LPQIPSKDALEIRLLCTRRRPLFWFQKRVSPHRERLPAFTWAACSTGRHQSGFYGHGQIRTNAALVTCRAARLIGSPACAAGGITCTSLRRSRHLRGRVASEGARGDGRLRASSKRIRSAVVGHWSYAKPIPLESGASDDRRRSSCHRPIGSAPLSGRAGRPDMSGFPRLQARRALLRISLQNEKALVIVHRRRTIQPETTPGSSRRGR